MNQEAQDIRSLGADLRHLWPGPDAADPTLPPDSADPQYDPGVAESFARAQLQLLDRINVAAAVLSRGERVVALNCRCQRIFGSSLAPQYGRLMAKDRPSNERLRKAIRAVLLSCSQPESGRGIICGKGESPILFKALPLGLSPRDGRPDYALLIFSSPDLQSVPDAALLVRAFGLTPAQARVACQVATGASLNAVAARLGVKKETVRNHLKQVFLRTGTCRQGELVALLSAFWLAAREENEEAAGWSAPPSIA